MKDVALITGASGGIGAEFAKIHASKGGDLVLVARRQERLDILKTELENQYGIEVAIVVEDLSVAGAAQKVFAATEAAGIYVDTLINNAGFGGHGKFYDRELTRDEAMMQLNMSTLTSLTHLYLQGMIQRRSGRILNVASVAAFLPGPLQAVYYATKAYVLSFSQAIAEELSGTGITVTVLCPGPVKTDFISSAHLEGIKLFDNAVSAESVAKLGYSAMEKGELVVITNGLTGFILNWITPFLPRRILLKISRQTMEK